MKLPSQAPERASKIVMITLALVVTGFNFLHAQELKPVAYPDGDPLSLVKNADKKIRHVTNVNVSAKATAVNASINSAYAELKPALAPNGTRLYFSRSLHPDNTNGVHDMEDIWYAEFDKSTNTWASPARLHGALNNAAPNFINNVSYTGDTIILGNAYKRNGKMKAGLSYSVNTNGQWSSPVSINIKNDYNISDHANAFVELKTGIIISAIQRVDTNGERDLYVSFWDGVQATEPINMGSVINSTFEESSPYLASDNKTLYFASKGHNGYGGYDIYVTRRLDDSWTNWSEPENLGPAVNGLKDEEFFSVTPCGKYAIFSKQVTVHNIDLFRISLQDLLGFPATTPDAVPAQRDLTTVASL